MKLIKSEEALSFEDLKPHENFISLDDLIRKSILIFPFTKHKIIYDSLKNLITSENVKIECFDKNPILIPKRIPKSIFDYKLKDITKISDPFFQYQILSFIKGNGQVLGVNADTNSTAYKRHLFRIKKLYKTCKR